MKDGKKYWINREAEEDARHVMGAVLVIVLACALGAVLVVLPLVYTIVCSKGGC